MKIRPPMLWCSLFILCASVIGMGVGLLLEKDGHPPFKNIWVQWRCDQALQTYLEQKQAHGSTFNQDWLTAQFYLRYDPDKTPGPYVFINLVGSNDPIVASHVRFINATGIFGPAPSISACTNSAKAADYYAKSPNSAYAHNLLALIHFQQGHTSQAIQDIRLAAKLVHTDFPATDLYSNHYQGLRALAWLVVNATNDKERYWTSQQFVDTVNFDEIKPYNTTLVDRMPLLTLYLDSLADVTRIRLHGVNGISKNRSLADHYLQRYWQICQSKALTASCDADLLKQYR